jgi:hypothetical protein
MGKVSHDFVTVDMRGLKAALVARAREERVSVSVVVRRAVARELSADCSVEAPGSAADIESLERKTAVKLSIRVTPAEASQLVACARAAGLSRGAYLAGLLAGIPVLTVGASRADHLAALISSSAELSTLSRNIHHLTALLGQGAVRPALEYRDMLDTLAGDVRGHLKLAARILADLRPRIRNEDGSMPEPLTRRRSPWRKARPSTAS